MWNGFGINPSLLKTWFPKSIQAVPEKCEAVFRKCTATSKKYGFGINPSLLKTWFPKSIQAVPEKCEAVFRKCTATSKKYGFGINPSLLKTRVPRKYPSSSWKVRSGFYRKHRNNGKIRFWKTFDCKFPIKEKRGFFGRVLTPIDCQFNKCHYAGGIKVSAALQSVEDKNPMKMPINRV